MRSDAPLIKYLSKTYSPKVGWGWQTLPLVQLPTTTAGEADRIRDVVRAAGNQEVRLPFNDFVLDLWQFDTDDPEATEPALHAWIRISTPEEYERRRKLLSPWDVRDDPETWQRVPEHVRRTWSLHGAQAVVESWTAREDREFIQAAEGSTSFAVAIAGTEAQMAPMPVSRLSVRLWTVAREGPNKEAAIAAVSDLLQGDVAFGLVVAQYLTMCPEYLVEEKPIVPANVPPRRPNDPKPWTYKYLPRIILLDPQEAPSGDRPPYAGGTHASPRPHQRRGHWATLHHPKYRHNPDGSPRQVFVKPAWVGPREWIMEGNRYRVLDVAGQESER